MGRGFRRRTASDSDLVSLGAVGGELIGGAVDAGVQFSVAPLTTHSNVFTVALSQPAVPPRVEGQRMVDCGVVQLC